MHKNLKSNLRMFKTSYRMLIYIDCFYYYYYFSNLAFSQERNFSVKRLFFTKFVEHTRSLEILNDKNESKPLKIMFFKLSHC